MSYYLDAKEVNVDDLLIRIKETDLIPSRLALLDNIDNTFNILKMNNCLNLFDLRNELKNAKTLASFATKTGIETQYLTLLKREVEGYFPKPALIQSFDWLQKAEIAKLESAELKNTELLYEVFKSAKKRYELSNTLGIDIELIGSLFALADLTRIQWVSPLFARMLIVAGYDNPKNISKADADELFGSIELVNKGSKYFKGKIGLRDIKRLIKAASYVL